MQLWEQPGELPAVSRALARLPFRQVWTTFPGDLLERAMGHELPDGWTLPRVITWERAKELDKRRRTLLKVLGDFTSYAITPSSTRVCESPTSVRFAQSLHSKAGYGWKSTHSP